VPRYRLSFDEDERGADQTILFEARDPGGALHIAQRITPGTVATLSQDDKPLCRIERRATGDTSDVWIIAPVDPE